MKRQTEKIYEQLPPDIKQEVDKYASRVLIGVKSKSAVVQLSREGAREVVIKTLDFMAKNEVKG